MPLEMILPVLAEQLAIGRVIQQRALEEGLQDDPEVRERVARAEGDIMQDVWMDRQIEARISDEALNEAYVGLHTAQDTIAARSAAQRLRDRLEEVAQAYPDLVTGTTVLARLGHLVPVRDRVKRIPREPGEGVRHRLRLSFFAKLKHQSVVIRHLSLMW